MLLLSTVAVSVSRRYPPYVVMQREAAAMRADVRQGDSSCSTGAMIRLKKSRALSQNVLRNAQAADVLQGNGVIDLLKPLKRVHSQSFPSFPIAQLLCFVRTAHHLGIAICIRTTF